MEKALRMPRARRAPAVPGTPRRRLFRRSPPVVIVQPAAAASSKGKNLGATIGGAAVGATTGQLVRWGLPVAAGAGTGVATVRIEQARARKDKVTKAFDKPVTDERIRRRKQIQGVLGMSAAATGSTAFGLKGAQHLLPKVIKAPTKAAAYKKKLDSAATNVLFGASGLGGASGLHQSRVYQLEGKRKVKQQQPVVAKALGRRRRPPPRSPQVNGSPINGTTLRVTRRAGGPILKPKSTVDILGPNGKVARAVVGGGVTAPGKVLFTLGGASAVAGGAHLHLKNYQRIKKADSVAKRNYDPERRRMKRLEAYPALGAAGAVAGGAGAAGLHQTRRSTQRKAGRVTAANARAVRRTEATRTRLRTEAKNYREQADIRDRSARVMERYSTGGTKRARSFNDKAKYRQLGQLQRAASVKAAQAGESATQLASALRAPVKAVPKPLSRKYVAAAAGAGAASAGAGIYAARARRKPSVQPSTGWYATPVDARVRKRLREEPSWVGEEYEWVSKVSTPSGSDTYVLRPLPRRRRK